MLIRARLSHEYACQEMDFRAVAHSLQLLEKSNSKAANARGEPS